MRPVESVGFDRPEVFPAAARLMPTDATYVIAIGSPAAPTANRPVNWAPPFAQYWLLPRRHVDDLNEAQWVLAFGTHAAAAGIRLRRVYPLAPGVELGEVAG